MVAAIKNVSQGCYLTARWFNTENFSRMPSETDTESKCGFKGFARFLPGLRKCCQNDPQKQNRIRGPLQSPRFADSMESQIEADGVEQKP